MKVWALQNSDGSFRGSFHRSDAYDCPGRRRGEEDRDDYVLADIELLPDRMKACQFPTCFAGRDSAADLKGTSSDPVAVSAALPQQRVSEAPSPAGAGVGDEVELIDEAGATSFRRIVEGAARPGSSEISASSPIGKALIGREPGDTVVVQLPRGERRFEVLDVRDGG